MTSNSPSKKRKRDDSKGDKYTFVLSGRPTTELGPVVASFPSAEPPKSTPFQCYYVDQKSADSRNEVDFADQNIFIAGEGKRVEFVTADVPAEHGSGTKYLVGIRSKSTKTITVRDCPFHVVRRDVKRLKLLAPIESTQTAERITQRSKLGEAFGTKKAIKALRARERNQVDVTKMEGVLGIIGEAVESRTGGLPTEEQAKATLDSSRPIPPYDPSADKLEAVYSLSTLIPDAELTGIRVSNFLSATDDAARLKMLPYARSTYVNTRLQHMQLSKVEVMTSTIRQRLQILVYMASLFTIRTLRGRISDRKAVDEKLRGLPQITIDGIMKRFTETPRGSTKPMMTSEKETLILTNLFALSLHIDNFVVDTGLIAKDLSMSSAKVNQLYKALGCRIEVPNSTDCARLGTSPEVMGPSKRAILRIPLQFPKERSGKKRNR